jgi:hypothetical protein
MPKDATKNVDRYKVRGGDLTKPPKGAKDTKKTAGKSGQGVSAKKSARK